MLASGVYDPSHVFPEAIKMQGAVQQQSLAALRTGYRMLCDVQGNASLSDKHQQVPLASPSSPFLPLTSPTVCQAAVVGAPRETIARQTSKSSQRVDHADTSALGMHVGMLCAHAARAYEPLSGRRGFFFPIESQVVKRVLAMMGWDKAMLKRKMPFTARQVPSSSLAHACEHAHMELVASRARGALWPRRFASSRPARLVAVHAAGVALNRMRELVAGC